jgi:hypothetical protein
MPGASPIRDLIEDLRNRNSKVTRAFDELFATNPGQHAAAGSPVSPHLAWLNTPNALHNVLPANVRAGLGVGGILGPKALDGPDLDHIDDWPKEQKELVRGKIAEAINNARSGVHFFWELHDGTNEITVIQDPDVSGGITITFRSPRSKIRVVGRLTGNATVDV